MQSVLVLIIFLSRKLTRAHLSPTYPCPWGWHGDMSPPSISSLFFTSAQLSIPQSYSSLGKRLLSQSWKEPFKFQPLSHFESWITLVTT